MALPLHKKASMDEKLLAKKDPADAPVALFDLRIGLIPFVLLEISNHFQKMRPGEVIEIIHCDAGILKDLDSILSRTRRARVRIHPPAARPGATRFRLRKLP
jgi:hypothetical protein